MFSGGLALLALLGIAACLRPDPSGRGTHQQLGLPPCTFAFLVGRPCPSCGMTTSWSLLLHGHPWRALEANTGGVLLALAALVTGPWLIASAWLGRALGRPSDAWWVSLAALVAIVTLVQWAWRMS